MKIPHGHADAVQIFFAKTRFPRQLESQPLGLIYTFERRIQDLLDGPGGMCQIFSHLFSREANRTVKVEYRGG